MSTTAPAFSPETEPAAAGHAQQPAPRIIEDRGFGTASLVLGLVSIVAGFTFVIPLAGLALGIVSLGREPAARALAIWGIVLSSIMLAGTVLLGIGAAVFGLVALPFAFLF